MSEVKTKKNIILTIEKELLSSYIEAVSDMRKLLNIMLQNVSDCVETTEHIRNEFDPIINKHVDRIKSSGIWE